MQHIRSFFNRYRELIDYVVVGVLVTGINWAAYTVLTVPLGVGVALSNALAWCVAVAAAFFLNKVFVFRRHDWSPGVVWREAGLFLGGRVFSGAVEIGMVPALMALGLTRAYFGVPGFAAKFLTSVVVTVLNYFLSKYAAFRDGPNHG